MYCDSRLCSIKVCVDRLGYLWSLLFTYRNILVILNLYLSMYYYYLLLCVCYVHICLCACVCAHACHDTMWRPGNNCQKLVFSSHHRFWGPNSVIRSHSKLPLLANPSQLTTSSLLFISRFNVNRSSVKFSPESIHSHPEKHWLYL